MRRIPTLIIVFTLGGLFSLGACGEPGKSAPEDDGGAAEGAKPEGQAPSRSPLPEQGHAVAGSMHSGGADILDNIGCRPDRRANGEGKREVE